MNQNWVLLVKVPDLIIRGALIHKLGEHSIEAYAPDRDAIINLSSSPNLSLEGYSALFDGYSVYVPRLKIEESKQILIEIERQRDSLHENEVDHTKKFYFASVMSFFVPGVLHLAAGYHIFQAIQKKQKFKPTKTIFSFLVLACSAVVLWTAISHI